MIPILLILGGTAGVIVLYFYVQKQKQKKVLEQSLPKEWTDFLEKYVTFFRSLEEEQKRQFERWVNLFLYEKRITPVDTKVTDENKLLIAASAIIPVFAFPYYLYPNLDEVLVYPDRFSADYSLEGDGRNILGMVGTGPMEGKMILAKTALEHGFWNDNDKHNVGIHEFIHLLDKQDGDTDGVPKMLLENKLITPWLEVVRQETEDIMKDRSDINPYAATNHAEFLAVTGEYFFESPEVMKNKHPELYEDLKVIFKQDPDLKKVKKGKK